ncbi:MAG: hypothetical protein J0I99_16160 [Devosia sp.]|uniref:hypothetical protein n=1 Tax=Devosia sp. TaxID=1871048 RepID=UPI001AC02CEC|nr:hypothetical protein [Devosia sp.]MBN9308784.1 hypothetical protein [Devosia sp.]MBN9317278.1 hypothetical protein [Devosia sp.]
MGQVLLLAFLSPELVESILAAQQPAGLTAQKLFWRDRLPLRWEEQERSRGSVM